MISADISLWNLTNRLVLDRAPNLDGCSSWQDLNRQCTLRLQGRSVVDFHAYLSPHRPFPGYQLLHVYVPTPPAAHLSAALPAEHVGTPAARALLEKVHQEIEQANYPAAAILAQAAKGMSSAIAPAAQEALTLARSRIDQQQRLSRARTCADYLDAFLRSLDALTADNVDAPRPWLTLLQPFCGESTLLQQLYRDRAAEAIAVQLRDNHDDSRRSQLLQIAGHYVPAPDAPAYRQAAALHRAQAALRLFRSAARENNLPTASTSLNRAEVLLAADLPEERAILNDLTAAEQLIQSTSTTDTYSKPDESTDTIRAQ